VEPSRTRTCDPRVKSQHLPFSSVLYNTNMSPASHRRSRISKPAPIASTASTVLTVADIRTLSNGKSPVRINQTAKPIFTTTLLSMIVGAALRGRPSHRFHAGAATEGRPYKYAQFIFMSSSSLISACEVLKKQTRSS